MRIFDPTNSLSGNIAIDLAIVVLLTATALRLALRLWRSTKDVAERRAQAAQLNKALEVKHEKVRELREAFMRARAKTQDVLQPYLDDQRNRTKIAASTSDKEIDSKYSELEEQLSRAAERRTHLDR